MGLICALINLYIVVIIGRIILSWFPLAPGGGMAKLSELLIRVTDPVLVPVRRILPSTGMLDLSPLVVILLLTFVPRVLGIC